MDFTWDDEDGERHDGRLEKSFRGAQGRGPPRARRRGHHRPGARRRAARRAVGRPDRGLLPLHGLGPPPRAGRRSSATRRALRDRLQASISGADRGTSRATQAARPRAPRPPDARAPRTRAGSRSPRTRSPTSARSSSAGEDALARLERDRDALARGPRAPGRGRDGARRAPRDAREGAPGRAADRRARRGPGALRALPRRRSSSATSSPSSRRTTRRPTPLPVLSPRSSGCAASRRRSPPSAACSRARSRSTSRSPPEVRWRPLSRWALVLIGIGLVVGGRRLRSSSFARVLDLGPCPPSSAARSCVVGLALAARRAGGCRRGDRVQSQLRDVEVDRRLRGRSEIEQELARPRPSTTTPRAARRCESRRGRGRGSRRGGARRRDRPARARLVGLIGDEPRDALPGRRDAAALEIEQKTSALDALGPIAKEPRARERLEVEVADAERAARAGARRRGERAGAGRAEPGRRRGGRRRSPSASPAGRRSCPRSGAASASTRGPSARSTPPSRRRCSARRATSSGAWSATSRGSPTAATGASGSTTRPRHRGLLAGENDWVPVTELSQGTLDVIYLAARLGLVRLVTGDRRPPLVLDDPFVTLDDARAARALELLRGGRVGLPGHLPHDVGPLRRPRRQGRRARRARPPTTATSSREEPAPA